MVAPTLFATLSDRALAGTIAGHLFRVEAWLSIVCAVVLLVVFTLGSQRGERIERSWLYLILAMFACTLIGYFGLHPFMAALREAAGPGGVMDSNARTQFGVLHAISSAIYLIQSLLGVALIFKSK